MHTGLDSFPFAASFSNEDEIENFDDLQVFDWLENNIGEIDSDWGLDWGDMTKISEMISAYCSAPRLQAKLLKDITLSNGSVMKKGSKSDLLIKLDDGLYHFESDHEACRVTEDEIKFIKQKL